MTPVLAELRIDAHAPPAPEPLDQPRDLPILR